LIVYIKFMEYYRYLDQLDFTKAQQCLNELESVAGRLPRIYRSIYNLEQFFSSIIDENGRSKAEKYITKETKAAMKAFKNDISIKRIEYTYYFRYMKDTAEAERCLQSAYALAKRYPVPAEAESNMLLIEYVSKQPKFNCEV
ncbi:MAG TPA: hypothetical protein VN131_07625, partial [Mobilitalea sp.]|nr:hypothetical protein [Mobilitalea sp.]